MHIIPFLLAALLSATAAAAATAPQPRSYLELPSTGKYAAIPYVWQRSAHGKQLVVIGTRHLRDATAPMFGRVQAVFDQLQPQLVLHEGFAPEELKALSREQAIAAGADLGFTVYLAHQRGLPLRSADAPVAEEIKALLAHYRAEEVLVFFAAQRLLGMAKKPDLAAAQAEYAEFFRDYLRANGFPDTPQWHDWPGFLAVYQQVTGRPLTAQDWSPDLISPVKRSGRLSDITRASMELRDRHLLAAIRQGLCEHDRVAVVFGSWHVLALEPVFADGMTCRPAALQGDLAR